LERDCPSWICTTWSDGKQTVVLGSFSAFKGCCAHEDAWIVGKPDSKFAPRQCTGSRVALHPQLSGMMMPETCWDTNKYIIFLHLVGYFFTFMIQDARSREIITYMHFESHFGVPNCVGSVRVLHWIFERNFIYSVNNFTDC
jgi:hypothetical protein